MAVANTKSTAITALDATTAASYIAGPLIRGQNYVVPAICEVAAADDDTSVYRFARVPSNAYITAIRLFNDAITGGTAYHVGVHQTAENGGAAVDNDVFATSVDCSSARVAPLDVRFEAANIDTAQKPLWEVLGLTSDPVRDYDITMTGATVGSAAGTLVLMVEYSV